MPPRVGTLGAFWHRRCPVCGLPVASRRRFCRPREYHPLCWFQQKAAKMRVRRARAAHA